MTHSTFLHKALLLAAAGAALAAGAMKIIHSVGNERFTYTRQDAYASAMSSVAFSVASGSSDVFCSPWQDSLLGSGYASASYDECLPDTVVLSTNAVTASGATSDNQEIIYHELCGDGQVIAKVSALTGGYAGLFVRESLGAGARKCAIATQLGSQVFRQLRTTTNFIQFQAAYTATGNQWLKINRSGTQVIGSWSTNGTSWNVAFNTTLGMGDCVFMGMYAYSTNSNDTIQATFTNVSVEQSDTPPATTIAFADSLIAAQSGDSIQICVTLQNPCACSPVSVDVVLATDSLPHFEGYEPVTLTFSGNDTVQCFYVLGAQADTSGVYSFELADVQGGNNTAITGPAALTVELDAGEGEKELPPGLCGSFVRENPEIDSMKTYYADRFGNIYEEEELLLPEELSGGCGCDEFDDEEVPFQSGNYFRLVFEDCEDATGTGFHDPVLGEGRRQVACRAYAFLAHLIMRGSAPSCWGDVPPVNIRIYGSFPVSGVLAAASSMYEFDFHRINGGIIDGLVWKMVNNPAYVPTPSDIFHGEVAVNFSGPPFYTGIGGTVPAGQFDLYTVMLHEGLHTLGLASLMEIETGGYLFNNGNAKSYSRWDTRLILEDDTPVIVRNITDPYTWNLNIDPEDLHKSCTDEPMVSEIMMEFLSHNSPDRFPIYTGTSTSANQGSSFSHLNENCPGAPDQYLMSRSLPSATRLDVTNVDRRILCNLGYNVHDMSDCSRSVAGNHDPNFPCEGESLSFTLCGDSTEFVIPIEYLIGNDVGATGVDYIVQVPTYDGIDLVGSLTNNLDGTLTFQPCSPGLYTFLYTPVNDTLDQEGNPVLLRLRVERCIDCDYYSSEDSVPISSSCNLICNPHVTGRVCEGVTFDTGGVLREVNCNSAVDLPGWFSASLTPDYHPTETVTSNSGSLRLISHTGSAQESVYTPLEEVEGGRYFFSYYYRAANRSGSFEAAFNFSVNAYLVTPDVVEQFGTCTDVLYDLNGIDLQTGNHLALYSEILDGPTTGTSFFRGATCTSIPDDDDFSALWLWPQVTTLGSNTGTKNIFLDEFEFIPDNFSAGADFVATGCDSLGGPFCMLSGATVLYEWFEVSEGDTLLIADYTVLNGVATVLSGDVDEETQQLHIAPLQTTTYILCRSLTTPHNLPGSFAFCTIEDAVTVTVEPAPEFGIVSDVCGLVTFYLNNLLPGDSSLITYGDGSSGTALVHTYANADSVYYASVFISNACRDTVLYVTVETSYCPPFSCEDCTEHTIGVRGEILKLSDALAEELLPADGIDIRVCVEGTLLIDANYNMINSILYMLPGSRIEIEEDRALSVVESYLSGCDTMWYAIEVQKGGQMKMIGSRVTDAQYAVYLHPYEDNNAPVIGSSIYYNDFRNNFVGLFVPRTSQGQISTGVGGNRYTQKAAALLPPFEGQSSVPEGLPEQNQHALAGIIVNDLSGFASLNNRFDSLTSGIVGERSTMVSSRDTFIAMRNNEAFYPTWDFRGKGVSTQSTGSQTALVEKGWFENCPQGIMANNTRLRATENKMLQVETGIWASLGNAGGITISDNHIEAAHLGIVASHPDPNGTVTITGNYVETDTENAVAGILEIFSMSPTLLNTDTVLVKEAGTGIWGYGARRIFMRDNRVEMDDPAAAVAGIFLLGVEQSLLETNTVLGSGTSGADNIALNITASAGNVYCCNTLSNTRIGTYVSGGSVATDNFKGTSFSNHDISLHLENIDALLGSQTHTQNCWGTNAGPAIYGEDENNPVPVEVAQEYPFTVDPNPEGNECFLPGEHFPMGWFQEDTDFDPVNACDAELCMLNMFAPESDDVKRIALGDTAVAAAVMWELQRYIYERLQGDTVQNASVLAFLAHADTSSIGAFYAISRSISELLAADSLEVVQLQANLETVEEKLDSLLLIDELLPEADSLEFIALQSEKNGLLNSLYDLAGENEDIAGQLLDFISDEAGKLRSQNDSIAVTEIYEINEKGVNEIYLSWLSTTFGALDSVEMAALTAIAEQCPFEGGNAVYRARAFLAALRQEYVTYNDSLLCAPIELLTVRPDNGPQLQIAKDEAGLSIFPNPASNEVKLVWSKSDENPGLVQVSDIYGRQVRQLVIASGTTEQVIQLAGLPDGVYVFRIRLNGRDTVRKVIIQR